MSRTLKGWEAYLSKQMPRVRLLSELGLNYEDMLEIANLIKGENKRHKNVRQTTKDLVDDFPCTFVAFLAAFAAQNTEREFWDAVARLIGVTGTELNNSRWRNYFIEILQKNHKPVFENLSFIYVANMRIHGGIPSYSLRDFFANMLMPSIENPEYIELKGKELLDALLSRSAVQMFTDSTVRNFFENTEEIGVKYLEDCRQVAKSYNSSRQIPSLHGLPSYVVDKLVNFLEYQEDEKRGLRRPKIKFDPEGDGLLVELPEEPISGTDVRGSQVRWQVTQNHKTLHNLNCRIVRSGRDVHSEEQALPLGFLIEPFQVSFSLPNQDGGFTQIREWNFDIRSQEVPDLLVFRSEDGSLIRWDQALPAQDLLLVHPKDVSLEFDGDARIIHSPDMYATGWQNWRAEYRALGQGVLSLVRDGEAFATVSIQKQLELPRLTGEVFQPNLDHKPLYLGGAPILRIPLRAGVDIGDELKRWKIEINSAWEAEPFIRQEFKLIDHLQILDAEETALKLNLAAVLGDEPKGTYTLRVRGPRETDVEISFRVWSSLRVDDLPEYILPTEDSKVILHFSLPEPATLEAQAGATGINITGQRGKFAVELDETVSELNLNLNLTWAREAAVIHVPVSIPVPRIKWRLVMGEESKVEWSNRSLRKPADAFLQSAQTPALLVQLPGIEDHKNLTLRLIDPENPNRALQEFTAQASVLGSGHARFLLAAKDTIAQNKDVSVFEFQLLLVNQEGLYQPVSLFSLTRDIDVSNVHIEQTEEGLFLLWDEPSPLKNRRVFIRSLWKAWADAWNIKISDDARGKFDLLAAGYGLPPSWYEVHFYVAPSWEQDIQSAPEHSTFVVKTISPEEQIAWLEGNLQKKPDTAFVNHFERACVYATVGESAKRDAEIQTCYSQVDHAKHEALFAFHEWLEKYDANTRRALRMKMYSPDLLQKLFADYKPKHKFRQKYLGYLLQTNLRPDSAILLLENENDPTLVFHALRELIKRQDTRFIGIVKKMVSAGSLSDSDALKLLSIDEQHSLSELDASAPEPVTLRLLSGLLRNKDELIAALSNEKILSLAKAELDPKTIKKYLGILIERQDRHGMEFIMELFQNGRLRGDEVTELLGRNPKFSTQILSNAPQTHAHSTQVSEIARKFPVETGYILAGMFIKTRAGWCRVDSIEDISGVKLTHASKENTEIRLQVTLHPDTPYSMMGVIHLEDGKLNLINPGNYYQCGKCGYVANDHNIILRQHTREVHDGIGGSFAPISTRVSIGDNLEFSLSLPK